MSSWQQWLNLAISPCQPSPIPRTWEYELILSAYLRFGLPTGHFPPALFVAILSAVQSSSILPNSQFKSKLGLRLCWDYRNIHEFRNGAVFTSCFIFSQEPWILPHQRVRDQASYPCRNTGTISVLLIRIITYNISYLSESYQGKHKQL